jgi:Diguanylate cyclase, GGDEF domain/Membrane-associated sensor, integral membrane domain
LNVKRVAERSSGALVIFTIVVIAIAAVALPSDVQPRLAILGPIAYFAAVLGDAATAVVLLATWRYAPSQRSIFVLAISFAASAVLLTVAMLVLPLLPNGPPVIAAPSQSGIWLYVAWHLSAGLGASAYLFYRRDTSSVVLSRRFVGIAAGIALAFTAACFFVAFNLSSALPPLAAGASVAGLMKSGVGPITALVLAVTAVATFRLREPGVIDRALAFSLLALTLDFLLLFVGGHRYSLAFYAGRILLLFGASFVLLSAIRILIAARTQLGTMTGTLSLVEGESARRAGRIRAVWEIASHVLDQDQDRFTAILGIATAAMRPGLPMKGILSHLDGETIVIDATSWSSREPESPDALQPGSVLQLAGSVQAFLLHDDRSKAWNDLDVIDEGNLRARELGWRSFIGTRIAIGRQSYFVTFTSPTVMSARPYAEDDLAYVDVVASFFAGRYQQQQQFERIQFQIEHDALTGLENRVQFRKAVREQIALGRPFSIAFADLDGFRHINEREGNQIGDEVLVEVASGLASIAESDLVARMNSASCCAVMLRPCRRSRHMRHCS